MKELVIKESEKVTEKTLDRECRAIGGISFKWISSNRAGVPDRICIFPKQIIKFVEVKSEGIKPSRLQTETFKLLAKFGFSVHIIDTRVKVLEFINEVKKELEEKQ